MHQIGVQIISNWIVSIREEKKHNQYELSTILGNSEVGRHSGGVRRETYEEEETVTKMSRIQLSILLGDPHH